MIHTSGIPHERQPRCPLGHARQAVHLFRLQDRGNGRAGGQAVVGNREVSGNLSWRISGENAWVSVSDIASATRDLRPYAPFGGTAAHFHRRWCFMPGHYLAALSFCGQITRNSRTGRRQTRVFITRNSIEFSLSFCQVNC